MTLWINEAKDEALELGQVFACFEVLAEMSHACGGDDAFFSEYPDLSGVLVQCASQEDADPDWFKSVQTQARQMLKEHGTKLGEDANNLLENLSQYKGGNNSTRHPKVKPSPFSYRVKSSSPHKEGWITVGAESSQDNPSPHGGTHVYVDADGNITKGPPQLEGKKPNKLSKPKREKLKHPKSPPSKVRGGQGPPKPVEHAPTQKDEEQIEPSPEEGKADTSPEEPTEPKVGSESKYANDPVYQSLTPEEQADYEKYSDDREMYKLRYADQQEQKISGPLHNIGTADSRKEHSKAIHTAVDAWVESSGITDQKAIKSYRKIYKEICRTAPEKTLAALRKTLNKITFAQNPNDLNAKWVAVGGSFSHHNQEHIPEEVRKANWVAGFARSGAGTMTVDGGFDPIGTHAHEASHVIDKNHDHSNSGEWKQAFSEEIDKQGNPLSQYARTHTSEGFAEFGRLVMTRPDMARVKFPKCWGYWQSKGLV